MITTNETEIEKFLASVSENCKEGYDGCFCMEATDDSGLYLAAAYSEEDKSPVCKIAYNPSILQCDYEYDWLMPVYKNTGDVAFVEILVSKENISIDAEYLLKELKRLEEEYEAGNLFCE